MLTLKQEQWINHLSDINKIKIVPFDPTAEDKFQKIKQIIQNALGENVPVKHRGATNLKISGQDEIDIYIPVSPDIFDSLINPLKDLFGEPGSLYPLERVRFKTNIEGKRIDVFLINEECDGWKDGVLFENYLQSLQFYRLNRPKLLRSRSQKAVLINKRPPIIRFC